MKDNVLFLNMFALYEPVEEVRSLLAEAVILGAELDPVQRTIDLELACPGPISNARLTVICREVEQVYGLKALRLKLSFPAGALYQMDPADLTALFTEENPMCMGSLAGAAWEWEGLSLTVKLRANGKRMIEEAIPAVRRKLKALCGEEVDITIAAGSELEGQALFDAMEKMRLEMIARGPQPKFAEKKAASGGSAPQQQGDTFYGKPFKGNPVPMIWALSPWRAGSSPWTTRS